MDVLIPEVFAPVPPVACGYEVQHVQVKLELVPHVEAEGAAHLGGVEVHIQTADSRRKVVLLILRETGKTCVGFRKCRGGERTELSEDTAAIR